LVKVLQATTTYKTACLYWWYFFENFIYKASVFERKKNPENIQMKPEFRKCLVHNG
jgi:hypothetical protein